MSTRVLVARHGAAEYETDTYTDAGGSLTAEGRAQSRALGSRLRSTGVNRVYASSMARATQTGELVAGVLDVGVTVREALREISVGDFEGRPSEPDLLRPIYAQWVEGDLEVRIPGAENGHECLARMGEALEEIAAAHDGGTALVVSHGGIICATLSDLATNLSMALIHGRLLPNCSVVELERSPSGWRCLSWPGLDL